MAFTLRKETFNSVHVNGYCDTELILILTVVSGIQQKSDICQVLKHLSSNLTASQNTALKEIISQTYVFGDKMTKY